MNQNLTKLQKKFKTKAKKAVYKASKILANYSALVGGNMSEHDRVVFDLKGYIVIPAVLNQSEIEEIKELVLLQKNDPQSLPPHQRSLPGGAFANLIDRPEVMNVLLNVIDPDPEKIRLENVFLSYREKGEGEWNPHAGGPTNNPNYAYNFNDGRIYAGMTRVVWELTEVLEDKGGTCFIPGSHNNSPRVAIFCAYNHINVRHHKPDIDPVILENLAPKHQRFFNDVYHPQFDRL